MILIMIVEDNEQDSLHLQKTLNEIEDNLSYVVCKNGAMAMEYLSNKDSNVDAFFIDYQMPGMDGYSLANKIRSIEKYGLTPIVFVTGYENDSLTAFKEYHCFSFIQKPFNKAAIEKKISFLFNAMESQCRIETKEKTKKLIDLSNKDNEIYVYADDILCIEASGKDCIVYTTKGKYLLRRKTLKEELREINQQYILRCHKSFAVNLMHVNGFTKTHQNLWVPIFKDSCEANCYISKTYFDEISDMYKKNLLARQ